MRKFLPIMLFVAAGSLAANTALAQAGRGEGAVIASDAEGALPVPEEWDCRIIQPDYRDWLEAGNSPESWRYVGHRYRNVANDRIYTWQDWLDWADDAGCAPPVVDASTAGSPSAALGVVVGFLGAGLIAALSGSGAKSPG